MNDDNVDIALISHIETAEARCPSPGSLLGSASSGGGDLRAQILTEENSFDIARKRIHHNTSPMGLFIRPRSAKASSALDIMNLRNIL